VSAPVVMRPPSGTLVPLGAEDASGVQMVAWEYPSRPHAWAVVAVIDGEWAQVSLEQWPSWEAAAAHVKDHARPISWWPW